MNSFINKKQNSLNNLGQEGGVGVGVGEGEEEDLNSFIPILNIGLNRNKYYKTENNISSFSNPLFTGQSGKFDIEVSIGSEMRLKDFLTFKS